MDWKKRIFLTSQIHLFYLYYQPQIGPASDRLEPVVEAGLMIFGPCRSRQLGQPTQETAWMSRTLTILFRRDPSRDTSQEAVQYEGYQTLWPDGRPVTVGLAGFCRHGQRLLSLGRHLAGRGERLIQMTCFPLQGRDDDLTRIPGYRVRRFFIERTGNTGRIHFLDGTPTAAVFEVGRDEPQVLHWIGLTSLEDGDRQWFDLAASPMEGFSRGRLKPAEIYNLF
jgi:hypothetical protein